MSRLDIRVVKVSYLYDKERWKELTFCDSGYEVSTFGKVRYIDSKRLLKPYVYKGYLCVSLLSNNKLRREFIHRLVALTFLHSAYKPGYQVHHKNRNRSDPNVRNLQWLSKEEHNNKYKITKDTRFSIITYKDRRKFTKSKVKEIKKYLKTHSIKETAVYYKSCEVTIRKIDRNKYYKKYERFKPKVKKKYTG